MISKKKTDMQHLHCHTFMTAWVLVFFWGIGSPRFACAQKDKKVTEVKDSTTIKKDTTILKNGGALIKRDSALIKKNSGVVKKDSTIIKNNNAAGKMDSTRVRKRKFVPTGLRLSTDVMALAKGAYKETFDGWEVNADIDFYRYLLAADYGYWANDNVSETALYHNNGTYYRVGVDVNFLKNDPDRNVLFLGYRRGFSRFSENMIATVDDPTWGKIQRRYENINATGKWSELTGGLKVKIWKFFWLGYTARFKFRLRTSDTPDMLPHDVPGYGRTDKTSYWGFNYQVMVRIPFRK